MFKRERAQIAAVSFLQIIVDGFTYDPGHSDLDDEQMIHVCMTLGDYRRANQLLSIINPPTNTTPAEAQEKTR